MSEYQRKASPVGAEGAAVHEAMRRRRAELAKRLDESGELRKWWDHREALATWAEVPALCVYRSLRSGRKALGGGEEHLRVARAAWHAYRHGGAPDRHSEHVIAAHMAGVSPDDVEAYAQRLRRCSECNAPLPQGSVCARCDA